MPSVHDMIFDLLLPVTVLLLAWFGKEKYEAENDWLRPGDHAWIPVALLLIWLGHCVYETLYGPAREPIEVVSMLIWTAGFAIAAFRWRQLGVQLAKEEQVHQRGASSYTD